MNVMALRELQGHVSILDSLVEMSTGLRCSHSSVLCVAWIFPKLGAHRCDR